MKTILALQIGTLLFLSTTCIAATVEYQHPDLTIVAREEPLDSVLKSLGKEMRIFVTIPTGLNPVVNCNIQHQPIKQAFKNLLGDLGYSLVWAKDDERLLGLTIFAGGGETAHEAGMEAARGEMEARMIEEQEAQESSMHEAVERHDAETAAYLESQGIHLPQ